MAALTRHIQEMLPFAVVGSEKNVVVDGKTVRGRKNRWGVINCEDERHCEFVYLRNFLTRSVLTTPGSSICRDQGILADTPQKQNPPARSDRDDVADPLRDVPVQAAVGAQGVVSQAAGLGRCLGVSDPPRRGRCGLAPSLSLSLHTTCWIV